MPFLVRPIARTLCAMVQAKLTDPNLVARPAYPRAVAKGGPVVMG